jgi:hypothetical protein
MKDQLENLHLEHLHTETSIAQLQRQFRDRGPGNGLQGNASATGSEHTDRRGAHMSSPYRSLDMSVLANSHTPATARSGAKRLEEAERQRLYGQSKGAGQEGSGDNRPEYLPKHSGPVANGRGRGGAEREDAYFEGAGGSGDRDGDRRVREGGDLGSSEAHQMLHRQLWSSSTPGIFCEPLYFACVRVTVASLKSGELRRCKTCVLMCACACNNILKLHRKIQSQVGQVRSVHGNLVFHTICNHASPTPALLCCLQETRTKYRRRHRTTTRHLCGQMRYGAQRVKK